MKKTFNSLIVFSCFFTFVTSCERSIFDSYKIQARISKTNTPQIGITDTFWLQIEIPKIAEDMEVSGLTVDLKDFRFNPFYVSFTHLQKSNFDTLSPTQFDYPVVGRFIKLIDENGRLVSNRDEKLHGFVTNDSGFIWRVGVISLNGFRGILKVRFYEFTGHSSNKKLKASATPIFLSSQNEFLFKSIVGPNFSLDPFDLFFEFK
jgi:hypothetical protein